MLNVEVLFEDPRWEVFGLTAVAEGACSAVLAHFGYGGAYEISLLGCDDARIAALNAQFRGKAQPTNVLAWPSDERAAALGAHPAPPEAEELGDIAIAWETCAGEAAAQGKEMHQHVTHLLVHATLHLLGYDHIEVKDAALMEGLEVEILGKQGISDPYEV